MSVGLPFRSASLISFMPPSKKWTLKSGAAWPTFTSLPANVSGAPLNVTPRAMVVPFKWRGDNPRDNKQQTVECPWELASKLRIAPYFPVLRGGRKWVKCGCGLTPDRRMVAVIEQQFPLGLLDVET